MTRPTNRRNEQKSAVLGTKSSKIGELLSRVIEALKSSHIPSSAPECHITPLTTCRDPGKATMTKSRSYGKTCCDGEGDEGGSRRWKGAEWGGFGEKREEIRGQQGRETLWNWAEWVIHSPYCIDIKGKQIDPIWGSVLLDQFLQA